MATAKVVRATPVAPPPRRRWRLHRDAGGASTATPVAPPPPPVQKVVLELTTEEAQSLKSLIVWEQWPTNDTSEERLNRILDALDDINVDEDAEYELKEDSQL